MKQCPTCQSQYTDDTLQFCLQDGSPLQFVPNEQSKTIAFGDEETVLSNNRPSGRIDAPPLTNPTDWNPNQYSSHAGFQPPEKKSSATLAALATAFVMLILFILVGIGAWFYFRGPTPDDRGNLFLAKRSPYPETANKTTTMPVDASKPTPLASRPANSSNSATTPAPVDREQIKRDVAGRVDAWKSAAESRNLDDYMSNYAPTIDYYNKKSAGVGTVRADKQRAFTAYDSIRITLSNMTVTPDAGGETATAVFDKEWVFSGAQSSAGKVQSELRLKTIGGRWVIAGERDLKVYYTR